MRRGLLRLQTGRWGYARPLEDGGGIFELTSGDLVELQIGPDLWVCCRIEHDGRDYVALAPDGRTVIGLRPDLPARRAR